MLFFLVLFLALLAGCDRHEVDSVPSIVENTFKARFPDAAEVEWELERTGYEAEFDMEGKEYTVEIDSAGLWKRMKVEISGADLPPVLRKAVDSIFQKPEWREVERLEFNGNVFYQIFLESDTAKHWLVFDSTGIIQRDIVYWD